MVLSGLIDITLKPHVHAQTTRSNHTLKPPHAQPTSCSNFFSSNPVPSFLGHPAQTLLKALSLLDPLSLLFSFSVLNPLYFIPTPGLPLDPLPLFISFPQLAAWTPFDPLRSIPSPISINVLHLADHHFLWLLICPAGLDSARSPSLIYFIPITGGLDLLDPLPLFISFPRPSNLLARYLLILSLWPRFRSIPFPCLFILYLILFFY